MPTFRKTLTLTLQPVANYGQDAEPLHSKVRSLLWRILAFDTRRWVYDKFLGGRSFHIVRKFGRLGFLFSQAEDRTGQTILETGVGGTNTTAPSIQDTGAHRRAREVRVICLPSTCLNSLFDSLVPHI